MSMRHSALAGELEKKPIRNTCSARQLMTEVRLQLLLDIVSLAAQGKEILRLGLELGLFMGFNPVVCRQMKKRM